MSGSEINDIEGLNFGSLPYDRILEKLEETDPDLVDEVRGYDEFHDLEGEYGDYVRAEIIDWTPDAPFLESDHTRRDPAISRSRLNILYNGTRGSQPELPRHPELFYGFVGNDPRGVDNTPRFDEVRGHITARAANLTVAMGDNDDHALYERPWTGQSISYGMKELHRRLKANTKIFTVSKEGRPWSRNVVTDQFAAGDLRAAQLSTGAEALEYQTEGFHGTAPARFTGGDAGGLSEQFTGGVRGVDAARRNGAEVAPWRHTTGDAALGVQQYGQKSGAGRAALGPGAVGGGRARAGRAEQDWAESRRAQSVNRQALGATMALAARHRRALKSGRPDQDPGRSHGPHAPPASGLAPARDVARLYRHTVEEQARRAGEIQDGAGGELGGAAGLAPARDAGRLYRNAAEDQARRPGAEIGDGAGGTLGPSAGLTPAAHPERAAYAARVHTTPNAHLANVESIVAGLREGTAASRRRIASQVVADGARHLAVGGAEPGARRGLRPGADLGRAAQKTEVAPRRGAEAEPGTRRGALPSADAGRIAQMTEMPLRRAAAASGLEVHAYRAAPPPRPDQRVAYGRAADERGAWRPQDEALALGMSQAPGLWRSASQAQHALGDAPERVFGRDAEVLGDHGGAPTGPKSLRSGGWSDSADLTDSVGGFSDGIHASA
jgi:hypothetical protein